MKTRIFALLTALLCLLMLASCAQDTPQSLYTDAAEQLKAAGGYEINAKMDISVSVAGQTQDVSMDMNMKANGDNSAVNTKMELMGQNMDVDVVYVDGVAYMNQGDSKVKTTVSLEELQEEAGMISSFELPGMSEEELNEIELTKDGDNSSFTVTLTGDEVKDFMNHMGSLTESMAGADATLSFGDMTITFTFDKDSALTNMKATVTATATVQGEEMTMDMSMDFDFVNIGTAPTISAPADADSYTDVSEQ